MQIRAVVGARVSDYSDDSQVSHTVQREAGERYALRNDYEVVGYFEDLDVSASVSPWERPDLGPWLGERAPEWDAMIFAKVDRAFRSIKDCADVAHWAEQHRKILVFTEDGITLNFRDEEDGFATMMAKVFLVIASLFAEMELKRIRARVKDAHSFIRTKNRWAGGPAPYGFMTIAHPEGGKTLTIDPESAEHVRRMARMVIAGSSYWDIASAFNTEGILTPTDYSNSKPGVNTRRVTPTKGTWVAEQVSRILRNPNCMGLKTMGRGANLKLVRGEDGMPVRISDPIFTDEEWSALRSAIEKRSTSRERSKDAAPLLGVVYCGVCGGRLYRTKYTKAGVDYEYYRCPRTAERKPCPSQSFKADVLQDQLDALAPIKLAEKPMVSRTFVAGEDHTRELEQVTKALSGIRTEFDSGMYDYKGGEEEYRQRMSSLVAQRKILEALPQRSDTWLEEPTGETYADAYERLTGEERRLLLVNAEIRLVCRPFNFELTMPGDVLDRLQLLSS